MSKRSVLAGMVVFAAVMMAAPVYAQGDSVAGVNGNASAIMWSIITAGFPLGIAAGLGTLGMGKAISSATEAIARNPSAVGDIRGLWLLGMVLIESLVIYVLLISLILVFLNPFAVMPTQP